MERDLLLVIVGLAVGLFGGKHVPEWVAWAVAIAAVILLVVVLV